MSKQQNHSKCPIGHKLTMTKSMNGKIQCSKCLKYSTCGHRSYYSCRICDYDLCKDCNDMLSKHYQNPSDSMQLNPSISKYTSKRSRNAADLEEDNCIISSPLLKKLRVDTPDITSSFSMIKSNHHQTKDEQLDTFLNVQQQQLFHFIGLRSKLSAINDENKTLRTENEALRISLGSYKTNYLVLNLTNIKLVQAIDDHKEENERLRRRLAAARSIATETMTNEK